MTGEVRDNPDLGRFEMEVDGTTAFVTCRLTHSGIPILQHMEVPKAIEGRGVGSRFAEALLKSFRYAKRKVIVTCPFIAAWIRKHPEFEDVLATPLRESEHDKLDERLDEALGESFPASDPPAVTPHR